MAKDSFMTFYFATAYNEEQEDAEALERIFKDNGIDSIDAMEAFETIEAFPHGLSEDNPFVIKEEENYVHLEWSMIEILLDRVDMERRFCKQGVRTVNGRTIDCLTFKTWPSFDDEPETSDENMKNFYFDVTAGYNAMG